MRRENFWFGIESKFFRATYRLARRKPSSVPYISGDGFRSLCSHFFESDNGKEFEPQAVHDGDLVFCEAWRLKEFLSGPAHRIADRFSIVSHNGDPNIDQSYVELLPPNVHRLFAQNVVVCDERVVALPIGLENKRLHYNGVVRDFERIRRRMPEKKPRIMSAFTVGNNPAVREEATKALSSNPLNDTVPRTNSRTYRKIVAEYMFVASPPGNGVDCHRTWEAMYLRSVPIVLRSPLTESFKNVGLPLLLVDSFNEVASLREEDLMATYQRMAPLMDSEALWFDYWQRLIRKESSCRS